MTIISLIILGLVFVGFIAISFKSSDSKSEDAKKTLSDEEQFEYLFSNIYNSLILFANSVDYLKTLAGPAFDPIFELESELDIGFSDYNLDKNVSNNKIDDDQKKLLLNFRSKVLSIPADMWTYEQIEQLDVWKEIRVEANKLLEVIGVSRREYNHEFTTIHYVDK